MTHVPAALVHVGERLVAGDAGVVDDDVGAAVTLEEVLGEDLGCVGRRDVEGEGRAADLVRGLGQCLAGGRDVGADHVCAVAGEDLGDGGADAAGCAGDDGDLALERLVPACGRDGIFGADAMTWPSTNADLAERRKRRVDSTPDSPVDGVGGDVDQLGGGAALDLLADAAGEAFERALRDLLVDARRLLRRRAENDDASRRCEVADDGLEELEQLLELG